MRSAISRSAWRGDRTGIEGKIADTFNEMCRPTSAWRINSIASGNWVGREGKARHASKFGLADGAWGEMESSGQHDDRRP